jgi:hypothetical protein
LDARTGRIRESRAGRDRCAAHRRLRIVRRGPAHNVAIMEAMAKSAARCGGWLAVVASDWAAGGARRRRSS